MNPERRHLLRGLLALGLLPSIRPVLAATLEREPQDLEAVRKHNDTMMRTALQGAEAIKRIQDYTRIRKDVPRTPVDVNSAVKEAVEIATPKWKS